jgi:putative flippase GtrA
MKPLKEIITPQMIRWIAIGVVFAAVGIGLIEVMVGMLAWPFALATLLSSELCTLLRFVAVNHWVFPHHHLTWRRLWRYHVVNALGFAIWWGAANLLKFLGVQYLLASALATFASVGFSMVSNFYWIWRKPTGKTRPPYGHTNAPVATRGANSQ